MVVRDIVVVKTAAPRDMSAVVSPEVEKPSAELGEDA